jgi:HlyD family secretion protein
MHPNPRKIFPVIFILALFGVVIWYFSSQNASAQTADLNASGTIEAVQIRLAAELGGTVREVLIEEGDHVQPGQILVRFDQEARRAQLAQAEAALLQAQANYDLVAAGQPAAQRQAATAAAELEILQVEQTLETLDETANLSAALALQAVAAAEKELDRATQALDNMISEAPQADIDAAKAAVVLARKELDDALEDFRPYEKKPEDNIIRAQLQARVAAAQKNYDALVTRLNNLTGTSNEYDLALVTSAKEVALARLADARLTYEKLKDGPDPDAVALANARLEAAEGHLAAAQMEPTPEQLALASALLEQAEAALVLARVQLDQTEIAAPASGVVLARLIEPGEVVGPGAALLTLADLDDLTITVYIAEDRYGTILLGQEANVSVDSFPGQIFTGRVIQIADQAEFTPRNVQTAEGRRTTVFAVKLAVSNPDGKLKIGMPADVSFDR